MSTADLVIAHTYAVGTVLDGDPRPHQQILKDSAINWRYSRNIGWYVRGSRDSILPPYKVNDLHRLADQLRAVDFTVTVEIDNTPRAAADVEADKADRADAREAHLEARAGRLETEATAILDEAHRMADAIPFGQPMMPDHYSYNRDRRYRDRIHAKDAKGWRILADARATACRAASVEHRSDESIGKVMRRIDTLATVLRDLERKIDADWFAGQPEDWRDYILLKFTEVTGKLDYWEQVLVDREAAGEKVWRREDFKKGDRVLLSYGGAEVVRVNPKTLTIRADVMPQVTNTVGYSKVIERHRPMEAAADAG